MKIENAVADPILVSEGVLSKSIESKELKVSQLILHESILSWLYAESEKEKSVGLVGLDELSKLRTLLKSSLIFTGKPTRHDSLTELCLESIKLASEQNATFITSGKESMKLAKSLGVECLFLERHPFEVPLKIESFFDSTTMSVHLKENVEPFAKKGVPGKWEFVQLKREKLQQSELKEISSEIVESPKTKWNSYIEIERAGSTIVQMGNYRIVITRPPFSDGWEITAVRPVRKMKLSDYKLDEKLKIRIAEEASGILVAGPPGSGKSTFASALAEYYSEKGKIVKTIEAPRDLQLPDNITQYAISHANAREIQDILLLSRPDYSVFDEMRNTRDFKLYIDLRLAGIGLAGVVHATRPIDAIQRFISRTEIGIIPQIIDTILFISKGEVETALGIGITVKVPTGMTEADLARPVVEVRSFLTKKLEYEIYTFGEQTVVIPITGSEAVTPANNLAKKQIESEMLKYTSTAEAQLVSNNKAIVYVPERDIAKIIGDKGKNIERIEREVGISLDVRPAKSLRQERKSVPYTVKERGNSIIFITDFPSASIETFIDGTYLFTSTTSKQGEIKISKKGNLGQAIEKALDLGKKIELNESLS